MPLWACFACSAGEGREGTRGVSATSQTRRTRPCGRVLRVWVVEGGGKGAGLSQTRKRDTGVAFSCLGCGEPSQTRRTRHWGRVLRVRVVESSAQTPERVLVDAFWCSRRGRGEGSWNTRTCPQGDILVFGLWGTCWWVGDVLGELWEAKGSVSACFGWRGTS